VCGTQRSGYVFFTLVALLCGLVTCILFCAKKVEKRSRSIFLRNGKKMLVAMAPCCRRGVMGQGLKQNTECTMQGLHLSPARCYIICLVCFFVFSITVKLRCLAKRKSPRNDLFCVKWDIKS